MSDKARKLLKNYAAVVITGGSSGIGRAFIERFHLLNPSLKICNLSRSAPAFSFAEGVLTHIPADLTQVAEMDGVVSKVKDWLTNVAPQGRVLLINNSGFGGYGTVEQVDLQHQLSMIDLNVRAVVHLTAALLPQLKTRGGSILTVASTASFQPTPFLNTYGATKAFVLNWSLALGYELRGSGVNALCLCPGPTESNFFRAAGLEKGSVPGGYGETAEAVVETALRALAAKKSFVVSGFTNKVMSAFSQRLPRGLITYLSGRVLALVRSK